MANENQNLTNPDDLIDVSKLNYFEGKIGDKYATKTALQGKSNINHNHDSRYYQQTEVDSKLAGKSDTGHTHDDRYYTETEVDEKEAAINSSITALEQKLEGPYYDAEHRCIVYPDYETANYNPATRGIYL